MEQGQFHEGQGPLPIKFHQVDLETAASLGCTKCIDELESGRKTHQSHDLVCPRSRAYKNKKNPPPPAINKNNKPPISTSVAASASSANSNSNPKPPPAASARKAQAQHHDTGEEGDVNVNIHHHTYKKSSSASGDKTNNNTNNTNDEPSTESAIIIANDPLRIGNNVDFPLSNLRSHLICSICKGYFRDPYTVADCLHTFCRSCLILFFRQGMRCCPTCNTRLGPDPFHTSISIQCREVIPDRTLQEVVNKIFPWMKAKEDEEERNFYDQRGIDLKPEYVHVQEMKSSPVRGSSSSGNGDNAPASAVGVTNDMLDLHLQCDSSPPELHQRLPPLSKSSLRVSGRLKVVSLKKYLVQKLGLKESKNSIEILCNGDRMGDELSLTFILRTRWFAPNKVLTLKYRLEGGEEDNK